MAAMLLDYKTTKIKKLVTFFESPSGHHALANTSIFADVSLKITIALLSKSINAASDFKLSCLQDLDFIEVFQVEVVHGLNFVKFFLDLFSKEKVCIIVVIIGVNHIGHVFPV